MPDLGEIVDSVGAFIFEYRVFVVAGIVLYYGAAVWKNFIRAGR